MKNLFSLTTLNLIKTTCISMFKDYPMFARLELTSKCNFRCEFCHVYKDRNVHEDISTQQVYTILDALEYAGVSFLYLTGGEALIRKDIEDILKYAKKKNMYILLASNGALFEHKFNRIHKYIDNIHFSIQTIKNFEKITSTSKEIFDSVCRGIQLAIKAKIPVQINVPIDNNNIDEMSSIVDFIANNFKNVEVFLFPIKYISSKKEDNEEIKDLLPNMKKFNESLLEIKSKYGKIVDTYLDDNIKILKEKYLEKNIEFCKAGNNMLSINSLGDIEYPCEYLKLQNIKILSKLDVKDFIKNINKVNLNNDKLKYCKNCTDSCYLQPSYFLTICGFLRILKNMFFN